MAEKWIAVTGCNGYIGGQTCIRLKDQGYHIIGIDSNSNLSWLREYVDIFIPGDFTNKMFANTVAKKEALAVIHIAGSSLVGPSIKDPLPYYINNPGNTAKLLLALKEYGWTGAFVFSSSAATYGSPDSNKLITESTLVNPISPYGQSKLMTEQIIKDCCLAYGFKGIAFRYFNACGADSQIRHGQAKGATHIIARLLESVKANKVFTLNGNNFNTPDQTCIRDYLHVEDIAYAHELAIKYSESLAKDAPFMFFNLSTGTGLSNKEVINAVEKITGKSVLVHNGPPRLGDPDYLVASAYKYQSTVGWKPLSSSLDNIIRTSWAWYNSKRFNDYAN